MKKLISGCMIGGALFTVGCGDVKVNMDDVNGVNVNDAQFAVFADSVEAVDLDGDGINDVDISVLSVIVSDQEDICAQIEADPDGQNPPADAQLVQLFAIKFDAVGAGGFAAGDTLTSNKSFIDLIFGGVAGDVVVDARAIVREADVDVISSGTDFFALNNGSLTINDFTAGAEAAFDLSVTLTQDLANEATFDTDSDGDGINDFLAINSVLTVNVKSATFCAALNQ